MSAIKLLKTDSLGDIANINNTTDDISSKTLTLTESTNPPLVVDSGAKVTNLNADQVDHKDVNDMTSPSFDTLWTSGKIAYMAQDIIDTHSWQLPVKSRSVADPNTLPPQPEGERYLVPVGAVHTWAGHDNQVAEMRNGHWVFLLTTPTVGMVMYIFDENTWIKSQYTEGWFQYVPELLTDLNDVTITSVSDGDILTNVCGMWINAPISSQFLEQHRDVTISTPSNNDVLKYNGCSCTWYNGTICDSGISCLSQLCDVNVCGACDGQSLVYNGTCNCWYPNNRTNINSLNDLCDVDTTGQSSGMVLAYTPLNCWMPVGVALDSLSDVNTTGTLNNYVLTYSCATCTWVAAAPPSGGEYSDGGDAKGKDRSLGNSDDYSLYFLTNGSGRMKITNFGFVGIGTSAPRSMLHVVGLPVYANNSAALADGLTAGAFYRTGGDPDLVAVVH